MDADAIKDLVENISQSVDNRIYLLREGLKNEKSSNYILKFSTNKLNTVNDEIEHICSNHLSIMPKIHEKLHVSYDNLLSFKKKIHSTNDDTSKHASKLLDYQHNVEMSKRKLKNIENLTETLNICIPALQAFDNLSQDLNRNQYINSIDNLMKLENEYLPRVRNFSFAAKITESLPGIKEKIINYAMNQAKTFLSDARAAEKTVGKQTIISMDEQVSTKNNDIVFDVNNYVDFSTILTCDYVYSVLGILNEFIDIYRPQRKQQLELCTAWNFTEVTIPNIDFYFKKCIGFFMIEDMLFQSIPEIVDLPFLQQMWDIACTNISGVIKKILSVDSSSKFIVAVKSKLKYLIKAAKILNLSKQPLIFISTNLKSIYENHLSTSGCNRLSNKLKKLDFKPITVATKKDFTYDLLIKPPEEFPVTLKFSKFAKNIMEMCDTFLERISQFMDGLSNYPEENYIEVLDSLKLLFNDKVPPALQAGGVETFDLNMLIQLTIDFSFFFNSIPKLCTKCAEYCNIDSSNIQVEFSLDEMIHPSFLFLRNELVKKSRIKLKSIFEESAFKSKAPNYENFVTKVEEFSGLVIYSFNDSIWKVSQFFLKKFLLEVNIEFLLQTKELLTLNSIEIQRFSEILKAIDAIKACVANSSHSENLLFKFDRIFLAITTICQSFENWDWKHIITITKEEPDVMSKDHIKLIRMLLLHLNSESLIDKNFTEATPKEAIRNALSLINLNEK